jgi:hypothetical protein
MGLSMLPLLTEMLEALVSGKSKTFHCSSPSIEILHCTLKKWDWNESPESFARVQCVHRVLKKLISLNACFCIAEFQFVLKESPIKLRVYLYMSLAKTVYLCYNAKQC